jgi:hypothetical protein
MSVKGFVTAVNVLSHAAIVLEKLKWHVVLVEDVVSAVAREKFYVLVFEFEFKNYLLNY